MRTREHVLIVGGGIAGLALAAHLGRSTRVTLGSRASRRAEMKPKAFKAIRFAVNTYKFVATNPCPEHASDI